MKSQRRNDNVHTKAIRRKCNPKISECDTGNCDNTFLAGTSDSEINNEKVVGSYSENSCSYFNISCTPAPKDHFRVAISPFYGINGNPIQKLLKRLKIKLI